MIKCPVCNSIVYEDQSNCSCGADVSLLFQLKKQAIACCIEGSKLRAKGDLHGAVIALRDAVQIDGDNAEAHVLLGLIYQELNLSNLSKPHCEKALSLRQDDPLIKFLIGQF